MSIRKIFIDIAWIISISSLVLGGIGGLIFGPDFDNKELGVIPEIIVILITLGVLFNPKIIEHIPYIKSFWLKILLMFILLVGVVILCARANPNILR